MGLDMFVNVDGEEFAYFRKNNALRYFFQQNLENFKDNSSVPIAKDDVIKLKDTVDEVLHELPKALMTLVHLKEENGKDWGLYYNMLDFFLETEICAKWKEKAKELFPTSNGFFFGDTEYNSGYLDMLLEANELAKDLLELNWDDDLCVEYDEWY